MEEVLYRYFREEMTADEKAEVETWRNTSPENQQLFDETKLMFLDLKGLSYYRNVAQQQVDQSWEKFKEDHKIRPIHEAPVRSFTFLRYAASIVVVIAAAIGVYFYQNQVEEVTLASTADIRELSLPDGSLISLNENARIEYMEPFQNNERRVKLTGEAYFEVAKVQKQPFVVEVGDTEIRVLGTKFYINRPGTNQLSVQVEEGRVLISHNDLHQIVDSGQTLTLDLQTNQLTETEDVTGKSSFWKTRKLVFMVTSLDEVVDVVNEAYDSSIQLQGSTEGCALTVTFDNETFENVLEIITSTLNYELIEDQGSYILKGDGCQ